ncbi:MAG: hypoxanthine phosphoribosyltransferase [Bacteroidaceae bacterium]|nr:hypoxanthine phosphoribosyltransferase [Bacteroidaceae bacterium]
MEKLQVKDKTFAISIPEAEIQKQVRRVAAEIVRDLEGKHPLFLPVLNGAFIFAADLLREVNIPCEVSFIKLASYQGTQSTGEIREVIGLQADITGRHIVIVEDIIDSGLTMAHMLETLQAHNPASISVCALLVKPGALKVEIPIHYKCMEIPNDFIVGYGLDYDGDGRNTRDIYTLVKDPELFSE